MALEDLKAKSYFAQYDDSRKRSPAQQAEDRREALNWSRRRGGSGADALPPPARNAPSTKGVDSMTWILQNRNQRRAESRGGNDAPTVWHIGGNYNPETGKVEGGRTFIEGGSPSEVPASGPGDAPGAGATDALMVGRGRMAYAGKIAETNERKHAMRRAIESMGVAVRGADGKYAKGYEWLGQLGDAETSSAQRNQIRKIFRDSFARDVAGYGQTEHGIKATNAPKSWTDKKRLDAEAAHRAKGGGPTMPGDGSPDVPRSQTKAVGGPPPAVPRAGVSPERREHEHRVAQENHDRATWLWTGEGKAATERADALKVGSVVPWGTLDQAATARAAIENIFAEQDVAGLRRIQDWMGRFARSSRRFGFNPLSLDEV